MGDVGRKWVNSFSHPSHPSSSSHSVYIHQWVNSTTAPNRIYLPIHHPDHPSVYPLNHSPTHLTICLLILHSVTHLEINTRHIAVYHHREAHHSSRCDRDVDELNGGGYVFVFRFVTRWILQWRLNDNVSVYTSGKSYVSEIRGWTIRLRQLKLEMQYIDML